MTALTDPSIIKGLSYFAAALLSYGALLCLIRGRLHRRHSLLPPDRQQRLLSDWRHLLSATRISLVLVPVCFAAFVVLFWAFASVPISLTIPLCTLLYLNLVLIHVDRRWHLSKLSQTNGSNPPKGAA